MQCIKTTCLVTAVLIFSTGLGQEQDTTASDTITKEIAVITEGSAFGAGFHRLIWNGKTSAGLSAPTGIYFYQADIKNDSGRSLFHESRKMLLVK